MSPVLERLHLSLVALGLTEIDVRLESCLETAAKGEPSYADFLAEYTYSVPDDLPVTIPEDLLWQAGERLYYPVAFTCYLFEPRPDEPFPPAPAQARPDNVEWIEITGVIGPMRARWKEGLMRYREYQAFPGITSRICSVLHKKDFHASIFITDVAQCQPWFLMRFVFYMVIGAMFGYSGYEIVHAGAIALDDDGILIVGSPGSGKSNEAGNSDQLKKVFRQQSGEAEYRRAQHFADADFF